MTEETTSKSTCGGRKKAMLTYGVVQLSTAVVSAVALVAIAVALCAVKQQSTAFNGCVAEVVASGESNAAAVRYCNGGG